MKSSVTPIAERCLPITPNIVFCCLVIVVAIITTTRRNYDINWENYCDDHSSLSSTTTVQRWIISDIPSVSKLIFFKVPISSKFLFSYLILYITPWTSAKEKFDSDKMPSFLEVLKTFKFAAILVHHLHQSSLHFEWVVTWIKEHMTSGLTYLACFTSVNLT